MLKIIEVINDPQLGKVYFCLNTNAKRYIIRIQRNKKEEGFHVRVTVPQGGNQPFAEKFFQKHRPLLLQKMDQLQRYAPLPKPGQAPEQEGELKRKAKAFLPGELERLARKHGLTYNQLKIRKSKTRWGSCSSKRTINLSFYLILLPQHLIEYVLLHELCHTVEMNHSPAFWALLDRCTGGQSKKLKRELSACHIPAL